MNSFVKMKPAPLLMTPDEINKLVEQDERLSRTKVAELFFSTKKRHLPDIYECRECGYQFPAEASCPECDSKNYGVFMHAPSRAEIRHHSADREAQLEELDPEWRSRFGGDADRAMDFYKPVYTRPVNVSQFQPPEQEEIRQADPDEAYDDYRNEQ